MLVLPSSINHLLYVGFTPVHFRLHSDTLHEKVVLGEVFVVFLSHRPRSFESTVVGGEHSVRERRVGGVSKVEGDRGGEEEILLGGGGEKGVFLRKDSGWKGSIREEGDITLGFVTPKKHPKEEMGSARGDKVEEEGYDEEGCSRGDATTTNNQATAISFS